MLDPRGAWDDPAEYDRQAAELAAAFRRNMAGLEGVDEAVRAAGPVG